MRKTLLSLILLFSILSNACERAALSGSTVVLIVRHAEKAGDAPDSPLTVAGVERAQILAGIAQEAGVSRIYTTQFLRSRETARFAAERLNIAAVEKPVELARPNDYPAELAGEILDKQAGQTVLVVGHGNTVAQIAAALCGRIVVSNEEIKYHDLFVVIVSPNQPAKFIKTRYGAQEVAP